MHPAPIDPPPATQRLPQWEEIVAEAMRRKPDPSFIDGLEELKSLPRPRMLAAGRQVMKRVTRDPALLKFLDITWPELIDLIGTQFAENHHLRTIHPEDTRPAGQRSRKLNRAFHQQPCTRLTVAKRVQYAERTCHRDAPILLLGDDDLVSLALVAAGFTNVNVVDIDASIIREIQCTAPAVHARLHDLNQAFPEELRKPYALVFLDPIYSNKGVELFLGSGLEASTNAPDTRYFLCLHLMSLLKPGLAELQRLLDSLHLEVEDLQLGFNSYPVPVHIRGLIHLVNTTVCKSRALGRAGASFPFFTSDAIVLKQRSSQTTKVDATL